MGTVLKNTSELQSYGSLKVSAVLVRAHALSCHHNEGMALVHEKKKKVSKVMACAEEGTYLLAFLFLSSSPSWRPCHVA